MTNPPFSKQTIEIIRRRHSCRIFHNVPIPDDQQSTLLKQINSLPASPFGTPVRFMFTAQSSQNSQSLRGLGTYGMIRNAASFIIGAAGRGLRDMEDFGYLLELLILQATDLGLGTCWLGGSFTRSSFAEKIQLLQTESLPAVCTVGLPATYKRDPIDIIQLIAGSRNRLGWEHLFFDGSFLQKMKPEAAGEFVVPLEMVRIAPSASNRQPWRIVRVGNNWNFFVRRTANYNGKAINSLLHIADLQRVDIGIAMCHFEAAASAAGLTGHWMQAEPANIRLDQQTEYCATWIQE